MKNLYNYNCKQENKNCCFKSCKNNTINSLFEVNSFLTNFTKFSKCLKIYDLLKK